MELKITTLIENMPDDAQMLACEHGLSLFVEFAGKIILFDTGQTGAFLSNAQKLAKDVRAVDYIVISHGHYDHSGGVMRLMESLRNTSGLPVTDEAQITRPIPMYVGEEFFHKKYKHLSDGSYRYNGNGFEENDLSAEQVALHKIAADTTYLGENMILFKNFKRYTDYEKPNPKFVVEREVVTMVDEPEMPTGGSEEIAEVWKMNQESTSETLIYEQDDFRDEMALGFRTSKGLVLVVGCSHVGIVNILQTVMERTGEKVYSVLGGTHLVEADEERLDKTMAALRDCGLSQIAVSHCTGEPGMERVEQEFGDNFVKNNTGHVYVV